MDTRVTQHTDPAPPYPESRKLILSGENQMLILYIIKQSEFTTKRFICTSNDFCMTISVHLIHKGKRTWLEVCKLFTLKDYDS